MFVVAFLACLTHASQDACTCLGRSWPNDPAGAFLLRAVVRSVRVGEIIVIVNVNNERPSTSGMR